LKPSRDVLREALARPVEYQSGLRYPDYGKGEARDSGSLPMRFVVITRLMSVVPPEQLTAIVERFAVCREEYKDRVRKLSSSMLVAVGGMVINVPDEVELNRMVAEYPLILYL
jgi:hypothetical protein